MVEQRPFKPFWQLRQELSQLVKARHFNQMQQFTFAHERHILPEFDNPSATRSATGESARENTFLSWQLRACACRHVSDSGLH